MHRIAPLLLQPERALKAGSGSREKDGAVKTGSHDGMQNDSRREKVDSMRRGLGSSTGGD